MTKIKVKSKNVREQSGKSGCSLVFQGGFEEMLSCGYTPLGKTPEFDSAISKIAELISSMTIHLMENRKSGDVRIKNALSRLIDIYPNNWMTRKTFIYNIVYTLLLEGNCISLPITKNGNIESLELIPPSWVTLDRKSVV